MCDIQKLKKICRIKKIFLIEDCAEALDVIIKKHLGTFGDISTFSFLGKTITTGEVEWSAQIINNLLIESTN